MANISDDDMLIIYKSLSSLDIGETHSGKFGIVKRIGDLEYTFDIRYIDEEASMMGEEDYDIKKLLNIG